MLKIKDNKNLKIAPQKEPGRMFLETASQLTNDFPLRVQEIIQKRFGFFDDKAKTLEKIGKDHGITRERIRQIIADANKKIIKKRSENPSFKKAESQVVFTINKKSGIIKKVELLKKLAGSDEKEANALSFLLLYSDKIFKVGDNEIEESLVLSSDIVEKSKMIINIAKEILEKEKRTLNDGEIVKKITKKIDQRFHAEEILAHLDVSKEIRKNNFGKWGVFDWLEISPKGTREKIYTILKEKKKPLHFKEIARIIDECKLSKKKAHPQTIHNELIKNEKFVLIGRGIYALREWGYTDGTVKDVLEEIFKKSGEPLTRDEILQEIMKVRKVKKATILINLGNSRYFSKESDLYFLKK